MDGRLDAYILPFRRDRNQKPVQPLIYAAPIVFMTVAWRSPQIGSTSIDTHISNQPLMN